MAKIPVVIEVQTRGQEQAQAAGRALDQVGQSAERAAQKVDRTADATERAAGGLGRDLPRAASDAGRALEQAGQAGTKFSDSVQVLGEAGQIGQRVRLLGEEVRNLGSGLGSAASVGNLLAGTLVDVAQVMDKAKTSTGGLVALLRANPLLLAAGVFTAIASAMSLFGDSTEETNSKLKTQIELQRQLKDASLDLAQQLQRNEDLQRVGFPIDQQAQDELRARRLAEVASNLKDADGFQKFEDLVKLTGLSEAELRLRAGTNGVARETFPRTVVSVPGAPGASFVIPESTKAVGLTNEAAREIILAIAQGIRENAGQAFGPRAAELTPFEAGIANQLQYPTVGGAAPSTANVGYGAPIGPGLSPYQQGLADRLYFPNVGGPYANIGYGAPIGPQAQPFQAGPVDQETIRAAAQAQQELNERLAQTRALATDVGTAIGSAFAGIVSGATTARQALAQLVQQFAALAQQQFVRQFANTFANTFAPSATQVATTNPQMTGFGPQPAP